MNTMEALYYNFAEDNPNSRALRNQFMYFTSSIPIVGDIGKAYDNWKYLNDYMDNRGLSWADVKYPSRVGMAYNAVPAFVSSNISRLYS